MADCRKHSIRRLPPLRLTLTPCERSFEGLTDYDPQTLTPVPAVATRWESSNDGRVWTFYLRDNARWSNGEKVTADDFVRSWERTLKIGPLAPHTELLANIEGATTSNSRRATHRLWRPRAQRTRSAGNTATRRQQFPVARGPSGVSPSESRRCRSDEPARIARVDLKRRVSPVGHGKRSRPTRTRAKLTGTAPQSHSIASRL